MESQEIHDWKQSIVETLTEDRTNLTILEWSSLQDAIRDLPNAETEGWGNRGYEMDRIINYGRLA